MADEAPDRKECAELVDRAQEALKQAQAFEQQDPAEMSDSDDEDEHDLPQRLENAARQEITSAGGEHQVYTSGDESLESAGGAEEHGIHEHQETESQDTLHQGVKRARGETGVGDGMTPPPSDGNILETAPNKKARIEDDEDDEQDDVDEQGM